MPIANRNPESEKLRQAALEIFECGLIAVDAREAIKDAVAIAGSTLTVGEDHFDVSSREIYVIAIGKAAPAMAAGFSEILGSRLTFGLLTGPSPTEIEEFDPAVWQVFTGGHPLPNRQSLAAADTAFELMQRAERTRAIVFFLISGGGSAMIERPRLNDISLDDLRDANNVLVNSGATIAEVNAVRRAFSAVKGGGLAAAAPSIDQISLIISDTNPGDLSSVASGPSLAPTSNSPTAQDVINSHSLLPKLPHSIARTIALNRAPEQPQHSGLRKEYLLIENQTALEAGAKTAINLGYDVEIAKDIREQPIADGCHKLVRRLGQLRRSHPLCLLSGGEFACAVTGNGIGGRNLETTLRCAMEISTLRDWKHVLVLSAGTDGIDGNSPAAGAVADESTLSRAASLGLDPQTFLDQSNSFQFFQTLDDLIVTGPTGTNVRDIRILLAHW